MTKKTLIRKLLKLIRILVTVHLNSKNHRNTCAIIWDIHVCFGWAYQIKPRLTFLVFITQKTWLKTSAKRNFRESFYWYVNVLKMFNGRLRMLNVICIVLSYWVDLHFCATLLICSKRKDSGYAEQDRLPENTDKESSGENTVDLLIVPHTGIWWCDRI